METLPQLQEIISLREENQRLRVLVEMREDRAELERYQIESRNKLLLLLAFCVVLSTASFIYYFQLRAQLKATQQENAEMAKELGRTPGKPPAKP